MVVPGPHRRTATVGAANGADTLTRDYAKTNVTIWQDSDFRSLPFPAQHLYQTMWTHPELSYCGVLDWRPGRLAPLAEGWTAQAVRTFADCLLARHFIVVDEETEEALVRSWVRWEEILKQPRLSVSYVKAFSAVASNTLRSVLVYELTKIRKATPDLVGFKDQRVISVLDNPSVSAKELPTPGDPFGKGLVTGLGLALGLDLGQMRPDVCLPPTPAPTPSPLAPRKNTTSSKLDGDFDKFWSAYPKKVDKGHAVKAWTKAIKKADPASIVSAAERFARENAGGDRQFIANPATWLNGERWTDEPARPSQPVPAYRPAPQPDESELDWDEVS